MTKVLGIDPGTHRVGWGLIDGTVAKQHHLASGCIEVPPLTELGSYLQNLHSQITSLLQIHKPKLVAIEKLFFQKNLKTAITVSQARGVVLLAITENNIPFVEYSPNIIKLVVTGNGQNDKKTVARMVGLLLGVNTPSVDDTSDALAIAITGLIYAKKDKTL